jgi:hypothetical protein
LLIAGDRVWRDASETAQAAKLLELWCKVSENLDNQERSIAARFQAAVVRSPDQLEKIINEFKELHNNNAPESLTMLFKQWLDEIVRRSLHEDRFNDTWIHWAIIALLEKNGREGFKEKLGTWLNSLMHNYGEFKKQWALLACLTDDLADSSDLRKRFPELFKTAIERFGKKSSLDKSRISIAGSLCLSDTMETVMSVWKKHFEHIIPDPAQSSNDYLKPVAWIKALLELNPDAYSRVIERWQVTHHRRRNLWKAMQNMRLPMSLGRAGG